MASPCANTTCSSSSSNDNNTIQKLDLHSVHTLSTTINHHLNSLLTNSKSWKSLKSKCTSKLKIHKHHENEGLEFSDHSIVSNLYWGIKSVDEAKRAAAENESESVFVKLQNAEKMLQIPASVDQNGVTGGIPNDFLVCCSYFYISIVRKLQGDEWQVAFHFLQALSVSPRIMQSEFCPEICGKILELYYKGKWKNNNNNNNNNNNKSGVLDDNEIMGFMAKEYKAWMIYYQIMSDKSAISKSPIIDSIISPPSLRGVKFTNNKGKDRVYYAKVHAMDSVGHGVNEREEHIVINNMNMQNVSSKNSYKNSTKSSGIKCLKDIITESESEDEEDSWCYTSDDEQTSSKATKMVGVDDTINEEDTSDMVPAEFSLSRSFRGKSISRRRSAEIGMCISLKEKTKDQRRLESFDYGIIRKFTTQKDVFDWPGSSASSFRDSKRYQEKSFQVEQVQLLEKLISNFCFTEAFGNPDVDYTAEITTMYKLLNSKRGLKYSLLKDMILDQLLISITSSKEEQAIRVSVTILSDIISSNKSALEDVKRKGLQLYDLVEALKRNVYEASVLIYLINPSPEEMKTLGILPCLVEVVCTTNRCKNVIRSVMLSPRTAALLIMEVLVTAFDCNTNNMHLSRITSPQTLSGLLDIPGNNNLEEFVSLANILIRCMRFDAECRRYIYQYAPLSPFLSLLQSNEKRVASTALEYFHELLQMPRSSVVDLLNRIREERNEECTNALSLLVQNHGAEYGLFASSFLIQLDMMEQGSGNIIHQEEALNVLFKSLINEENYATQSLSASILSNIGGTYSWTAEPYTSAWLSKKTGLTSIHHKNMIKNFELAEDSQQDAGIDAWCSKLARRILKFGDRVFYHLEKGLSSKSKRVSYDCLTAIAWLGSEVAKSSDLLQDNACEVLLSRIEQHLHPGIELEERLLACLCIYNYTFGRGMKNLVQFSEGVRESLRRLANVTWMAEELLRVADYFQPNKWRISCVHSQIVEVCHIHSGAVTALIYYKGHLYSGYADGSLKVWDIKEQTATLVQDIKIHKKAVTCFSLQEQGNCLLTGSTDKTIKIWKMVKRNLECIESIALKDSIQSICNYSQMIFTISQGLKMKAIDGSRNVTEIFKNKKVKTMRVAQGKVYAGSKDSSIQELLITNNRHQEIRAPQKKWSILNKPINSLVVYKDWLYAAGKAVEGSKLKDWRRNSKPQISVLPRKRSTVIAMEIVEDFIYLHTTASKSSLQIWLRETQHNVGRLSAGSKITSILSANDMILCGTETGIIKGWIPL